MKMEIFDQTKSIIENLYLLSGPILALFGFLIFYQIKISKKSIEVAKNHLKVISERDAATSSAERTDHFVKVIVPIGTEISTKRKKVDFPEYEGKFDNWDNSNISQWDDDYKKALVDHGKKDITLLGQELINLLEGFSIYFTNGIANEKIAYGSVGSTFCNYVEKYYTTICLSRKKDKPHKPYSNVVELYELWNSRIDKSEKLSMLNNEEEILKEKLKNLIKEKSLLPKEVNKKKPIGT
ncbi:hypothetical protein [Winogradskyella sediminis]|uniref:DUF4760 domain-containing protein n=1 Tax=Winogradskyella sediminis TaxID=1382466 RepID=UPI003AA9AF65